MGIKRNFIYNILLTLSSYIAGLIVFPYVSRTLGVSNIGIIGFIDNLIDYFVLFSSLGITTIGIREIAACGNDITKRSEVFSNLFIFSLTLTVIVTLIYIIAMFCVPQLREHRELLYIGISKLIFSSLLIEWFYKGIEQFRYVALRNIGIKLIYVISVFILIRKSEDYTLYFILTTASVILNSLINIIHARKYSSLTLQHFNLNRYCKQIFSLGAYSILTSMYTTFNVIYLGFACGNIQVGYYYTATKIFYIILGFLSAFTTVMLPRMSALISEGKKSEFNHMINNSFVLVFSICFPIIILSIILAPQIIQLLAGESYEGSIIPMQIIMPIIFVTGVAQILVIQVLIPLRKDKVILIASIIGASVGITLNLLLVKNNGAIGSSIVLLVSDICTDLFCFYYLTKKKIIVFPYHKLIINLLASLPYIIVCYISIYYFSNYITALLMASIGSLIYFIVCQVFIIKNKLIINQINLRINKKSI